MIKFLAKNQFSGDRFKAREVRWVASYHLIQRELLYRQGLDGVLLRCLIKEENLKAMRDAHEGTYGEYQCGKRLYHLLIQIQYFLLTMYKDCIDFACSCQKCELHAPLKHLPPEPLHSIGAYWSFQIWGLDFIGLIYLLSSKGHV